MKTARLLRIVAACLMAVQPPLLHAEDIDLYAGIDEGARERAAPNVLFLLDNTSNWSANNNAWTKAGVKQKCDERYTGDALADCHGYAEQIFGANASRVQGQVEVMALRLVLNELVCREGAYLKVNAGTMFLSDAGTVDGNSYSTGYIRKRVAPLDATYCGELLPDLDTITGDITGPAFKAPSSANYGLALYEAFKYFGGWTNPAGAGAGTAGTPVGAQGFGPVRNSKLNAYEDPKAFTDGSRSTYKSPIDDLDTCGKNYIVLVGNTWPNQEPDAYVNQSPPVQTALSRLGDQSAQIYPVPLTSSQKSNVRFADEWSRFLYGADVSETPLQQNVRMFTLNVFNKAEDPQQTELLKSMAEQSGQGGYYEVDGDLYRLIKSFESILTQIAAVNSVFASSSLPVSVNAQGTYLNQVFIGMFRPDNSGQQRWAGNLKQYRFALGDNDTLFLADLKNQPAVDTKNTGFMQNCAQSYWTADTASYWQTVPGALPGACTEADGSTWSDAPDGPLVERGAAAQRLRESGHATRNLRTCADASCSSLIDLNKTNITSIAGVADADVPTLIDWIRGANTGDGSIDQAGNKSTTQYGMAATATRPTVHGAVVHSRPLAVNYGGEGAEDVVVFYGSGDGTLRAIDGSQSGSNAGKELWAFVARDHLGKLDRVRTNIPLIAYPDVGATPDPTEKDYFFDGSIGGYQERNASASSKVYIYPAMRRGGRMIYGFDVSTKPGATSATQPQLMWRFGCSESGACTSNAGDIGHTWSTPQALRVRLGTTLKTLVAFGGGYDDCEDAESAGDACASGSRGRGIYVMDAQVGPASHFRHIDLSGQGAGRFAADLASVDVNGDGVVDVFYAVDTRGNIWRVNTSLPGNPLEGYPAVSDWPVLKVATVADWSVDSERRKFLSAPSVVVLGTQATVLVGTGDREKPLSLSEAAGVDNRFYGIRDDFSLTTASEVPVVIGHGEAPEDLVDVTDRTDVTPMTLANSRGWFFQLQSRSAPYEQVVTTPLTIGGVTYFSTYQAQTTSDAPSCSSLGTARAYQVNFQTGTKLLNQPLASEFLSGGIPPSPVGGVVLIDGQKVPFLIGGPGPSTLSPAKVIPKLRPNRKPIYRYERID